MEPEIQPPQPEARLAGSATEAAPAPATVASSLEERFYSWVNWSLIGSQGVRAGWLLLIFFLLNGFPGHAGLFSYIVGTAFYLFHLVDFSNMDHITASLACREKLIEFLSLVGAVAVMALIEGRRNCWPTTWTGPRRIPHFLSGVAAGFLALSALVGAMAWGGWLHFGPVALSGAHIFKFGAIWGCAFLLVGCVEEGTFRGYLQFTLTRGINFWWALGTIGLICLWLLLYFQGQRRLGRLCHRPAGAFSLPDAAHSQNPTERLLAGGLGHFDALRLHPHRQRRRKLDWHLCRGADRLCLLRQRAGHRHGLVGHRLPRRMGLGGDLLLRHRRQRHGRAAATT
jgi:hypothetical protein